MVPCHLCTLERGVLQGSVLSPALFLLIMDTLLKCLQSKGLDLFIGETYAGAFIHADDIHTVSTVNSSLATLQEQQAIQFANLQQIID